MKISVITAVYNREATIGYALLSVASQNHKNIEHIVQDGGSTDATLSVIKNNTTPIVNLHSAPDGGIYDALNKAVDRCTGDVIGLLHSDDIFAHDDVLAKVAEAFEDPSVDGVYGDLDYVSADNISRVVRHWEAGPYERRQLKFGWMPPHPTIFLRREVFDRLGAYDLSYTIAADYEALLRWLWHGHIRLAYIPEVLVKMRLGGESNRSLERIMQKSREDYQAIRQHRIGGAYTLALKNARKLGQFIAR